MAIPSKDSFFEYLNFSKKHRPDSTFAPLAWEEKLPGLKELSAFLLHLEQERRQMIQLLGKTEVEKWFEAQPYIVKASQLSIGRLKKNKASIDIAARADLHAQRLLSRWNDSISNSASQNIRLHVHGFDDRFWFVGSWREDLAGVLCEYFHSQTARESIETRHVIDQKLARIKAAIQDLRGEIAKIDFSDYLAGEVHASARDLRSDRLSTVERMLSLDRLLPKRLINPLSRKDPRAKERLLVYRCYRLHRRWGGFRPPVVEEIMYAEGIEHQYDRRTIERLYAQFTGKKSA